MFGRLKLSSRSLDEERQNSERERASPQQPSSTTLSPRDQSAGTESPARGGDAEITSPILEPTSTPEGRTSQGTPASSVRGKTPGSVLEDADKSRGTPASMTSSVSCQPGTPLTGNEDSGFIVETPSTKDHDSKTQKSAADEGSRILDEETSKDHSNDHENPESNNGSVKVVITESEPTEKAKQSPENVSGDTTETQEKSASAQDVQHISNNETMTPDNSKETSKLTGSGVKDPQTSETNKSTTVARDQNVQNSITGPRKEIRAKRSIQAAPSGHQYSSQSLNSIIIHSSTEEQLPSFQPPFGRESESSTHRRTGRVRQEEQATVTGSASRFQTVNALSQLPVVQCAQRSYGAARANSVIGCGLRCMEACVRVITFPATLLIDMFDAPFRLADKTLYNGFKLLQSSACAPQICCGDTPCSCLIPIVYRGEDTQMDPESKP